MTFEIPAVQYARASYAFSKLKDTLDPTNDCDQAIITMFASMDGQIDTMLNEASKAIEEFSTNP